jgi:hypothetical protein
MDTVFFTIWFRTAGNRAAMSIDVASSAPDYSAEHAQQVWDQLKAGGFLMISSRP